MGCKKTFAHKLLICVSLCISVFLLSSFGSVYADNSVSFIQQYETHSNVTTQVLYNVGDGYSFLDEYNPTISNVNVRAHSSDSDFMEFDIYFTGADFIEIRGAKYSRYQLSIYPSVSFSSEFIKTDSSDNVVARWDTLSVVPFVVVNGVRYDLFNNSHTLIPPQDYNYAITINYGIHIQASYCFMYQGKLVPSGNVASYNFGYFRLKATSSRLVYSIYAINSVSSDGQAISSSIDSQTQVINNQTQVINNQTQVIEGQTQVIKDQTQVIKDQTQAIDKQTEVNKEQLETSKGIFGAISDFFGSFFDNLISMIVGLVIPSSEDILSLLDEINQWFGDRLGFIWYPFGLVYELAASLAKGDANTSLTVPAFSLNILGTDYVIWHAMPVDIDAFGIMKYVRLFTSFLMVSGVVRMAIDKWDEWIGGHDS